MQVKFNNYFKYAIAVAQDEKANLLKGTCQQQCKFNSTRELCCAKIEMYNKNGKAEYSMLQCMDINVFDISTGLWIDDFYYEYECDGY